jgi:hypothetical protein
MPDITPTNAKARHARRKSIEEQAAVEQSAEPIAAPNQLFSFLWSPSKPAVEPMPKMPPLWVRDLPFSCHTGDIVLFSSKHSTSNITKFFTNSSWDHIGVIVVPKPGRAYLVEWGGGLFASELVRARVHARATRPGTLGRLRRPVICAALCENACLHRPMHRPSHHSRRRSSASPNITITTRATLCCGGSNWAGTVIGRRTRWRSLWCAMSPPPALLSPRAHRGDEQRRDGTQHHGAFRGRIGPQRRGG